MTATQSSKMHVLANEPTEALPDRASIVKGRIAMALKLPKAKISSNRIRDRAIVDCGSDCAGVLEFMRPQFHLTRISVSYRKFLIKQNRELANLWQSYLTRMVRSEEELVRARCKLRANRAGRSGWQKAKPAELAGLSVSYLVALPGIEPGF